MKKVILPTDFSENAYNASKYAVQLFKDMETTFYLLHTYTPPIFQVEYVLQSPSKASPEDSYKMKALEQLRALKERLQKEFDNPRHTFVTYADFNTLPDDINIITKREKADLVVMGTQGATNAAEILFGTHTTQVINKALCAVIAVPSDYQYEAPTNMLFPTDYEIDYRQEQLQLLLDLAKRHEATVDVLHISTGPALSEAKTKNKQKLETLLAPVRHAFHELPDQGVIEGINQFQEQMTGNLLAMVRNKHTFFERLFVEPIIKKIGLNLTIPFMVMPHYRE